MILTPFIKHCTSSFSNRLIQSCCLKEPYRKSFLPSAIRLYNSSAQVRTKLSSCPSVVLFVSSLLHILHLLSCTFFCFAHYLSCTYVHFPQYFCTIIFYCTGFTPCISSPPHSVLFSCLFFPLCLLYPWCILNVLSGYGNLISLQGIINLFYSYLYHIYSMFHQISPPSGQQAALTPMLIVPHAICNETHTPGMNCYVMWCRMDFYLYFTRKKCVKWLAAHNTDNKTSHWLNFLLRLSLYKHKLQQKHEKGKKKISRGKMDEWNRWAY